MIRLSRLIIVLGVLVVAVPCYSLAQEMVWEAQSLPIERYMPKAVWGPTPDDVFFVSGAGFIVHRNKTKWEVSAPVTTQALSHVGGTSASDVVAVGAAGTILHYDGADWTPMPSGTSADLACVWAVEQNLAFALGSNGLIMRYDGTSWSQTFSDPNVAWGGIWGSGSDDVYAVGGVSDGQGGLVGKIYRYDGLDWSLMANEPNVMFAGVWGFRPRDILVVGNGTRVRRYNDMRWSEMAGSPENASRVWCSRYSDIFVADRSRIWHFDGSTWTESFLGRFSLFSFAQDLWGTGPNNVFFVKTGSYYYRYDPVCVRFDGSTWSDIASPVTELLLSDVWAGGSDDVYAVASYQPEDPGFLIGPPVDPPDVGGVFHGDGAGWSELAMPVMDEVFGVYGVGPNDVYAVGDEQMLLSWDGSSLSTLHYEEDPCWVAPYPDHPDLAYHDAWTDAAGNGFIVGGHGQIMRISTWHWAETDYRRITPCPSPGPDPWNPEHHEEYYLRQVWGSGPNDIFLIEGPSAIIHYDGSAWSQMPNTSNMPLYGLWGSGPNDIYAVGYTDISLLTGPNSVILHYDGSQWTESARVSSAMLVDGWSCGPNDVYIVGAAGSGSFLNMAGAVFHYDGSKWSTTTFGLLEWLQGVWGSGPNDVFAVGLMGTILHYDGASWSDVSAPNDVFWSAVWGSGPNDVFVVGHRVEYPLLSGRRVEASGWSIGTPVGSRILHYDGAAWAEMPHPEILSLASVWGSGPNDVFVAGAGPWPPSSPPTAVLHYNGSEWSATSTGNYRALLDLWGCGPDEVYVVGGYSAVLCLQKQRQLTSVQSPTTEDLFGVWASDINNVFAVGGQGTILRYDGAAWSVMDSNTTTTLRDVRCFGPNDVFAVGKGGTILHYDGSGWLPMASPTTSGLEALWGRTPSDLYAVGDDGILLRSIGQSWSLVPSPTQTRLNGLCGTDQGDLFAVGDWGLILHYPVRYGLTIDIAGQAGCRQVTVDPDLAVYDRKTPVTLTAEAEPGYIFLGWLGVRYNNLVPDNPLQLPMTSDARITAVFIPEGGLDPNTIGWRMADGQFRPCGAGAGLALVAGLALSGLWLVSRRR